MPSVFDIDQKIVLHNQLKLYSVKSMKDMLTIASNPAWWEKIAAAKPIKWTIWNSMPVT